MGYNCATKFSQFRNLSVVLGTMFHFGTSSSATLRVWAASAIEIIVSSSCVCCVGGFVMRALSPEFRAGTIESGRPIVGGSEQSFGEDAEVISAIARMLWPSKTAAHIAAATNCSVRAAEFYLSGQRDWSGDALAAIVQEILKRHSMRNVRVTARK